MTMDELNAIYNNMSVYGDTYTPPITTIPTDPNAGQPPILEPLIPIVQQLGRPDDNNDGGIKTLGNNRIDSNDPTFRDPFNDILENYIQENEVNPDEFLEKYSDDMFNVQETKSKGIGIQSLIDAYQKFSPLGMVYRAGNNVLTNTQKYFADKKKQKEIELQEEIARENEAAANRARVEAYTGQRMSDYRQSRPRSEQNYTGGDTNSNPSTPGAQDSFGNKSGMGRTGYGTGGIVTL